MPFHLAQCNVVKLKAPLDSPEVAGFVAALDPINAVADAAPGFVWRLKTDEGDATSIRVFADDQILLNMSVWESIEALKAFVYQSDHKEVLRRRREWADRFEGVQSAMWWIRAGTTPEPIRRGRAPGGTGARWAVAVRLHVPRALRRADRGGVGLADSRRHRRPGTVVDGDVVFPLVEVHLRR